MSTHVLATIGYEAAMLPDFLRSLQAEGVTVLVDVRAVASSRRPGFAKSRLSEALRGVGIEYIHMRRLGTPSEGRAAAKKGRHSEMRAIYLEHLATGETRVALHDLADLIRATGRVCIMCFEADPEHCHRNIVAHALQDMMPLEIHHLRPAE